MGAPTTLSRLRFASLQVRDQLINLSTIQRPLNPQDDRQRNYDITVGQEQIMGSDVAMRNKGLVCFFAGADQDCLFAVPEIMDGGQHPREGVISRLSVLPSARTMREPPPDQPHGRPS